ncbi:ComZ family protein [Rossellomorea marisflavi]|jgi:competence protein ComZ|uniref:ComZ family protein n=1 Tax=Rossellomorea marisflavi TaxID=189381 RepID=UPI0006FA23C1|nr:ComZ family protein [Rossellomorea marisflavi]KQU60657.1 competence protein ComG [Bacillus sp. Leaf406]MDR4937484.1 ComZ family protein [Rossellomorea marisflavi]MDW4526177.1 ComZ family protein [Rossellomorea marisflavi]VXB24849.1 putative late competence gene [Bacillus sp. 349Y]
MNEDKTMQFLQIAMKYLPEAQEQLEKSGIQLSPEMIEPFLSMFTNVMNEAYELGKQDSNK